MIPIVTDELIDYHSPTNRHGIDRLALMIKIIEILESEKEEIIKKHEKLVEWLSETVGRKLLPEEKILLAEGFLKYVRSEPETNERIDSMKYLFEAEFLKEIQK